MNKVSCLLTGGHRYSDNNMIIFYDSLHLTYTIKNYCVKCGKVYTVDIPDNVLIIENLLMRGDDHDA